MQILHFGMQLFHILLHSIQFSFEFRAVVVLLLLFQRNDSARNCFEFSCDFGIFRFNLVESPEDFVQCLGISDYLVDLYWRIRLLKRDS